MTLLDEIIYPVRELKPGTTGWSVADLDDPAIDREWSFGRYELIEGVLSVMPAASFDASESMNELVVLLATHVRANGVRGGFGQEVDVVLDESRVVRADMVYLDPPTKRRQKSLAQARRVPRRSRVLVPPTLIVESVSVGHEIHDRRTKRRWYAEFGVPNYWILDVFARSLECLRLEAGEYVVDAAGTNADVLKPSAFPGLAIPLAELWDE